MSQKVSVSGTTLPKAVPPKKKDREYRDSRDNSRRIAERERRRPRGIGRNSSESRDQRSLAERSRPCTNWVDGFERLQPIDRTRSQFAGSEIRWPVTIALERRPRASRVASRSARDEVSEFRARRSDPPFTRRSLVSVESSSAGLVDLRLVCESKRSNRSRLRREPAAAHPA